MKGTRPKGPSPTIESEAVVVVDLDLEASRKILNEFSTKRKSIKTVFEVADDEDVQRNFGTPLPALRFPGFQLTL